MKKICFMSGQFPLETQTFVVNQVVSAINNKFNVKVCTYNKQSYNNSTQTDLLKKYGILNLTSQIDFNIPNNKIVRLLKGISLSLKHYKYLKKAKQWFNLKLLYTVPFKIDYFLTLKNVDVFHVHFGHYGIDLALMKKMGVISSKMITTFHGYDANVKGEKEKNILIKKYEDLFKQSDVITVNTNYLKGILLQLKCDIEKLEVIPMGIDTNLFKCHLNRRINKKETINLISIGRLIELKGHEFAIKSVKKLIDKGYKVNYTIIGTGRLKRDLEDLILKLDVADSIFLVGKKSQTEIKDYLNFAHLFLMSSVTDSDNRREAQGVVTLEAQASGLPVVAFDSGGVKDTLENNKTGFLITEKDIDAYTNAISKLIDDESLYESLSKAAPEFVNRNFNIDKTSEKFISLYNKN